MSKPFAQKMFAPAGWIVAVAVLAAVGVAGSGMLRSHSGSAIAKRVPAAAPTLSTQQSSRVRANMGALPLAFEANQGQTDPQVKYLARGNGYTVFLTATNTVFALSSSSPSATATGKHGIRAASETAKPPTKKDIAAAIRMQLVGGNPQAQITASSQLPGVTNYYIGGDPSKWQAGVKQYAGVTYRNVYPGVNLAFHGEQRQLEFDLVVAADSNPAPISLGFSGVRRIATDESGNLLLSSAAGNVIMHKPVAYQDRDGKRESVAAKFVLESANTVGFALGSYDHGRELVIDPALSYSTYLGGSGEDEAFGIAVDASGSVYVAGQTTSINFPAQTGTLSSVGGFDAFVTKLNPSGSSIVFTTLIGGTTDDAALGVAVNGTAAYVIGNTTSSNFPSTVTLGPGGGQDAFVASLNNATGAAVYVTRIGGTGTESGNAISVDSSGNAYLGGETLSIDFPTVLPIQGTINGTDDAFVAKLNSAGTALSYSTYLGGSSGNLATGIALDSSNNAYVTGITVSSDFPTTSGAFQTTGSGTGDNGFVTEIKTDGSALVYSTYLAGNGTNDALGIAVDSAGEAYVAGTTNSSTFPTANAAQPSNAGGFDVFVTKFNATGTGLMFSTYYGGTLDEVGTGIALDSFGDAYVTGRTLSSTFPVSGTPFQSALSGTSADAFVTELSNTGFVVYSSFLGGTGNENSLAGSIAQAAVGAVAVDSTSNAYLAGATSSTTGFPLTSPLLCCGLYGGGLADGFVAKVGAAPADFSIAVSPTSTSATSGQSTSAITVTVSSVNASFGQAVALTCGNLPSKAVCHFTSASVTPGSSAVTSSLTIATNGASSSSMLAPNANRGLRIFYAMFLPIGGVALLGAGNNSRRKRLFGFLLLGAVLLPLLILPACGGGSSGGGGGGGGGTNTPPGTYTISVSGQAGSAMHSASFQLTVN